jgi:CTP:molybdopterin cytidylyltransferase MocA
MGTAKATVPLRAGTPLGRILATLKAAGAQRLVVVLGAEHEKLRPQVPPGVEVVINESWQDGQTSSVKAGLRRLDDVDAVVIAPVDRPFFTAQDVRALVTSRAPLAVATHAGRKGHPLLVRRAVIPEIMALAKDEPLHTVVHRDPQRLDEVDVGHDGIHLNIDTPADLERAKAWEGSHA